ncbi:MAG: hypothetical protein ACKOHG_04820, partial [Planctomycetia bacterium]
LGALLPDGDPAAALGGVVPLSDLDAVDLIAIAKLARILDAIRTFALATAEAAPVADWCDVIQQALEGLCDAECPQLSEPLVHLRRLREAARGTAGGDLPVPFEDVHQLLTGWLDETSGRQPLRTGAITATSMVPLRGVPFRVVCVIGYDDGTVGAGEADGDDLVARQQLVGDGDQRADERRALLDCLLAAGERLVITCNGRNVKSNKRVPLVTPLAELVDFAVRHGAAREKFDEASGIEIGHPRHQLSRRTFEEAGVEKTGIWSHDTIAGAVLAQVDATGTGAADAARADKPAATGPRKAGTTDAKPVIDLDILEMLVNDPLQLFLTKTLGVPAWRKDEEATPATLPMLLEHKPFREFVLELVSVASGDSSRVEPWMNMLRSRGVLPFGPIGERQALEIRGLAEGIVQEARKAGVPLGPFSSRRARIDVGGYVFASDLPGFHDDSGQMVILRAEQGDKTSYGFPLHVAAIRLVAARAAGLPTPDHVAVVARHKDWEPGALNSAGNPIHPCQIRKVKIDAAVDPVERLARWCELACEAMHERRGLFGLRNVAPDQWEGKFDEFLAAKNHSTGES